MALKKYLSGADLFLFGNVRVLQNNDFICGKFLAAWKYNMEIVFYKNSRLIEN